MLNISDPLGNVSSSHTEVPLHVRLNGQNENLPCKCWCGYEATGILLCWWKFKMEQPPGKAVCQLIITLNMQQILWPTSSTLVQSYKNMSTQRDDMLKVHDRQYLSTDERIHQYYWVYSLSCILYPLWLIL